VTQSGTAASLRSTYGFTQPAAGKTGTTNGYKDAWFAGYTSSLTGCVWVGLDKPATIVEGGYGGSLALPIWANIFKKASALREAGDQPRYPAQDLDPNLVYQRVTLCRESAKRITSGCQSAGTAYQDLVPEDLVPSVNDYCTVHPLKAMPAPSANGNGIRQQPAQPQQPRQTTPPRALPIPNENNQPQRALPVPE
jgi:penicillin-binding protein 1A